MALSRSIIPTMLNRDWWDAWDFPSRIFDQHFGNALAEEDVLPSRFYRGCYLTPARSLSRQNSRASGVSEVRNDPDKFQVMLDVSHFSPNEIVVKTVENSIVVTAKHEEKVDEHGFVSREFSRRYLLPKGVEPESVTSNLTADGVLTVQAPKKSQEPLPPNERTVPIAIQDTPAAAALPKV